MSAAALASALLLDAALGEPRWLWSRLTHPAVLIGRLIGFADKRYNAGKRRQSRGILVLAGVAAIAGTAGAFLEMLPGNFLIETIVTGILLAHRSLSDHVRTVARAMRVSLSAARSSVAHIVGRDTDSMDEPAVARAAIESAAENLSDGVVAPAFWFLIAGLPGILIYKTVNTADSMIGYRTERHEEFGWAAARLDDLMNWLPARLTAALIWLVHGRPTDWKTIRRDARMHRSPNAGWPEAAMAAALNVALSGPRSYGGRSRNFPFVNPDGSRHAGADAVDAAARALWRCWAALVGVVALMAFFCA